ncbi:ABC transporter substrate-binding protein [Anaerotalea alkaliphila]|uniref:Amino acid ABC transporter substrate-binding protein n=1 Tax=Anaerotalea alkaliphila TaxID=2662126 RepID=A0A7X5HVY9_9FIRM|nr:ABC transporter substrate-binding protein [Anaerotalea alkaliphila]NDL67603.1 amino acid ABC transporter substrate-binding protein [Anaerotalea alkaliphila]
MKKALLVAVMAAVLTLAACGGAAETDGNVLRIGVDDAYPPMEFRNDADELVGFDVDFAHALGEELGMEVEFIPTAWDGIFTALVSGSYDVVISSVSITPDRMAEYDMTDPYLANGQVIVVRSDAQDITDPSGLAGKTVGVQIETTSHASARKYQEEFDFQLDSYDQIIQTFMDLKADRLDAIVVDGMVAAEYISSDPGSYRVTSAKLSNEPIGVCLKKGANPELLENLNNAIATLRENGRLAEISMEWLGADYTTEIDSTLW